MSGCRVQKSNSAYLIVVGLTRQVYPILPPQENKESCHELIIRNYNIPLNNYRVLVERKC